MPRSPPPPAGPARRFAELDRELAIRTPSPRLRSVSRSLGRQLLRPAEQAWPERPYATLRSLHADGPMQPVALGAVAGAAGLSPHDAALCALHHLVGAITTAAVRLLGLDPFRVHALAAGVGATPRGARRRRCRRRVVARHATCPPRPACSATSSPSTTPPGR